MTGEITQLIAACRAGNDQALDKLVARVYNELRQIAKAHLNKERFDHTLQTTALTNEAYLRLAKVENMSWRDRQHFFSMASRQMRRVLVDHARSRSAAKRGGTTRPLSLDDVAAVGIAQNSQLIELDDALTTLGLQDERQAQIVELRFFGGLTASETGEALCVSAKTVQREFAMAKAWLRRELAAPQA